MEEEIDNKYTAEKEYSKFNESTAYDTERYVSTERYLSITASAVTSIVITSILNQDAEGVTTIQMIGIMLALLSLALSISFFFSDLLFYKRRVFINRDIAHEYWKVFRGKGTLSEADAVKDALLKRADQSNGFKLLVLQIILAVLSVVFILLSHFVRFC